MKKIGLIAFILALVIGLLSAMNCSITSNLNGAAGSGNLKTETRNVSGFKNIEAANAVNLEIVVGENFSAEVKADDNLLENVKTEVDGDTLKIFTEKSISSKNKISVTIKMPELEGMELSGASTADVINVKADSLELKASGASKIKISGEAKNLDADASGASNIDAETLLTENAEADSSGASKITVSAANELKAESSGASTVIYTGEPKNITQNSSGASSVKKK